MLTQRQERLGRLLREEISELIQRHLKDPRLGMVTVTEVVPAPDLREARVFVSVYGDADAQQESLAGLHSAGGFLHEELKRRLRLRRIPHLEFRLDDSLARGSRILDLLEQVRGELRPDDTSGDANP